MDPFSVFVPEKVYKEIREIPLPWRTRVSKVIELLSKNPFLGKKMRGEFEGQRKIRIWPYRLMYRVEKGKRSIFIVSVKHRGSIGYQ